MNVPVFGVLLLVAAVVLGVLVLLARKGRPVVRHSLIGAGLLLASLPLGVVVTLLLLPLWSWIEENFGIESVGHSGPADWCYLVTIFACALALLSLYAVRVRRRPGIGRG